MSYTKEVTEPQRIKKRDKFIVELYLDLEHTNGEKDRAEIVRTLKELMDKINNGSWANNLADIIYKG